ncbi:hypothetical protein Ade02nite_47130 [Paractinoplanes deccanensis]|uniref:DUF2550 family protein n=1 Tax=Paractinoplanes deccanensis TaxID=113561 RepID=A0ABQ3Y7U5_9ACTN|nr:hypothetical protein [Actinoplanes deccanensis]GID76072.1 hypothetical protein Ade02nite_47130 [Actinoplanes deccanensis]
MKIWLVPGAGVVLLALVWVGVRALRRRPAAATRRLAQIVCDVFGDDWARRLGLPPEQLRAALVRGAGPAVAHDLGDLVEGVELRFDRCGPREPVETSVTCRYRADQGSARAQLRMGWDHLPPDVRAQFLREGATTAVRRWEVPVP